jgi:hypothetical protein
MYFDEISRNDAYFIGVDPGQAVDPTAIVIARMRYDAAMLPTFQVGHLERLPLRTPYPGVVHRVGELLGHPLFRGCSVVLDETGVGQAVRDLFEDQNIPVVAVAITAGIDEVEVERDRYFHVPKLQLVSRVQSLLHDGRLRIQQHLPETPVLLDELQNFQQHVTDAGRWTFGARSGRHDDLVLALALAVWRGHCGRLRVWEALAAQIRRPEVLPPPDLDFVPVPGEVVVEVLQRVWSPQDNRYLQPGRQVMTEADAARYAQYLA